MLKECNITRKGSGISSVNNFDATIKIILFVQASSVCYKISKCIVGISINFKWKSSHLCDCKIFFFLTQDGSLHKQMRCVLCGSTAICLWSRFEVEITFALANILQRGICCAGGNVRIKVKSATNTRLLSMEEFRF